MGSLVEISESALWKNVSVYRRFLGKRILCAVIKANAYGHGLEICSRILEKAGADWFAVHSLEEAFCFRKIGIRKPLYILGPISISSLSDAVSLDCRIVIYNRESVTELSRCAKLLKKKIPVHLKVETGNCRQGVDPAEVFSFARFILSQENLLLEGICTHFSNIEDTGDHSYADFQLKLFKKVIQELELRHIQIPIKHCANTAATLLFPETYFDMVRVGIGLYGLCPSSQVFSSLNKKFIQFYPVLSWKSKIMQIKRILKGSSIGYGCTYRTRRSSLIGIIPVGYFDGYDRSLSNKSFVLIRGKRAPVRGRICMNLMMVDITDIPGVCLEDEVILIGHDGCEVISADTLAEIADTIHYEIVSRIREGIPRVVVE